MTQREDVFRLPPMTEDEVEILDCVFRAFNPLADQSDFARPDHLAVLRKLDTLRGQVEVKQKFLGKTVVQVEPEQYDEDGEPIKGTVREVLTAEEFYERDWEDMDAFPEENRGNMYLNVAWHHPDSHMPEDGYRPGDLKVVES